MSIKLLLLMVVNYAMADDFESYPMEFGRVYHFEKQYEMKKEMFLDNLNRIWKVNQQDLGFVLKVSNFTDWKRLEIEGRCCELRQICLVQKIQLIYQVIQYSAYRSIDSQ